MSGAAVNTGPGLVAMYPGSFDPIHLGHLDVIEQAVELFGSVVVVAMNNTQKSAGGFTINERVELIRGSTSHLPSVRVAAFAGLAIDAAAEFGVDFIVKGLRNSGDFEVEQQMAQTNHSVSGVRTVYLPCRADQAYISSRFIRDIAHYGRDVSHMVPALVAQALDQLRNPKA